MRVNEHKEHNKNNANALSRAWDRIMKIDALLRQGDKHVEEKEE